jgi:hypothetical protein
VARVIELCLSGDLTLGKIESVVSIKLKGDSDSCKDSI